jgi:hypothetical protein
LLDEFYSNKIKKNIMNDKTGEIAASSSNDYGLPMIGGTGAASSA